MDKHFLVVVKIIFRYYFEPSDGTCHKFFYGGCEGNKNNFQSLETCKSRCSSNYSIPVTEKFKLEFCFLSKDIGSDLAK